MATAVEVARVPAPAGAPVSMPLGTHLTSRAILALVMTAFARGAQARRLRPWA